MSTAQSQAQARYDKYHTTGFYLKMNNETDKDIIERLDAVSNRQGYIKELIRRDIKCDVVDWLIMWRTDTQWNTEMIQAPSPQKAVELARELLLPQGAEITEVAEIRRDWN